MHIFIVRRIYSHHNRQKMCALGSVLNIINISVRVTGSHVCAFVGLHIDLAKMTWINGKEGLSDSIFCCCCSCSRLNINRPADRHFLSLIQLETLVRRDWMLKKYGHYGGAYYATVCVFVKLMCAAVRFILAAKCRRRMNF